MLSCMIKRQIRKGIHSSTRTVYEWWKGPTQNDWSEDRLDAKIIDDEATKDRILNDLRECRRNGAPGHDRVLCYMAVPI